MKMYKFSIIIIALVLSLNVLGARAQEEPEEPIITTETLWHIDQQLCPEGEYCNLIKRISRDGGRLYMFDSEREQLYVIFPDNQIAQYDFTGIFGYVADILPYDDHRIIIFDRADLKLHIYDLDTALVEEIIPGQRFIPCDTVPWAPFDEYNWVGDTDWVLTCGSSITAPGLAFSLINVTSRDVREVINIGVGIEYRSLEWQRVVPGYDNAVYIQPSVNMIRDFALEYIDNESSFITFRYDLDSNTLGIIETSWDDLKAAGYGPVDNMQLVGADEDSNIYFFNISLFRAGNKTQYTKINARGEVVWILREDDFSPPGPTPLGVTPDGQLILTSSERYSTVGMEIYRTTINWPPSANAGPDQTLTATGSTATVTLDASASSDRDDSIVGYSWTEDGVEIASGETPEVDLSVGAHTLSLTVTDEQGAAASDEVVVTVEADG